MKTPKHIKPYLTPDFQVRNDGSIVLLQPVTDAGREWCEVHLPEDCPTFGSSFAIETRYAGPILEGMDSDGLTYEVNN